MGKKGKNDKKVKVRDKRKFDSAGNRIAEEKNQTSNEAKPNTEAKVEAKAEEPEIEASTTQPEEDELPEILFSNFLLSLGTQAMTGLGLLPDPISNETKLNLPQAKQMIDIIVMLRKKTKGNLEAFEITMIDNLLFDLRMQYVERSSKN